MSFSNTIVLFATAFLLVASAHAVSQPKRYLRRPEEANDPKPEQRFLKSAKGPKSAKGGGTTAADTQFLPIRPPTAPPVKLQPNLEDWDTDCVTVDVFEGCLTVFSSVANSFNCKMCLFGLARLPTPPSPMDNGVKLCANGPTCGLCSADEIRPYYACGLEVDRNFTSPLAGAVAANPGGVVDPVGAAPPATPVVTPAPPVVRVDTVNCPAVWPKSQTVCVMLDGFDAKECVYHEYSADSVCTCTTDDLFWTCVNGPTDLEVAKDDPTTVGGLVDPPAEEGTGTATAEETMPKPVVEVEAVISSFP